jgi:hypothetical protein
MVLVIVEQELNNALFPINFLGDSFHALLSSIVLIRLG